MHRGVEPPGQHAVDQGGGLGPVRLRGRHGRHGPVNASARASTAVAAGRTGARRPVAALWTAVAVGVARVHLGAHNPLDVVAGAGLGRLIGGLLTVLVGVHPPRDR